VLKARKGGVATLVVEAYLRRKMRGAFRGVWLRGALPKAEAGLLLYANHTGWWDGFVVHALAKDAGWDGYCLMEEEGLLRYPFLGRIGAFSVRKGHGPSALAAMRYARSLLQEKRTAVFLFPEGTLRPGGEAPLRLERGVEVLARFAEAACVPVAIRYAFLEHERPDVLLQLGTPHGPGALASFATHLLEGVTSLASVRSLDGFRPLLSGRQGVAERWDRARGLVGLGRAG
jgi:1-acyl-sn-glycerol-3-phosphate acyltransferase